MMEGRLTSPGLTYKPEPLCRGVRAPLLGEPIALLLLVQAHHGRLDDDCVLIPSGPDDAKQLGAALPAVPNGQVCPVKLKALSTSSVLDLQRGR